MFVWDQFKAGSVNLEKVRNFTIRPNVGGIEIIAWFNDSESVLIGSFKTDAEAAEFLEKIHKGESKWKKNMESAK